MPKLYFSKQHVLTLFEHGSMSKPYYNKVDISTDTVMDDMSVLPCSEAVERTER
jgi:hypothetical protein